MSWPDVENLRGEKQDDLFELKQSVETGFNPLTVGLILSITDPRSQVWFRSGNGLNDYFVGGKTAIYNPTYNTGDYKGAVLVIDSKKNYQTETFSVHVEPTQKGILITNFTHTKAAGHVAEDVVGSGLQATFSITSSVYVKRIVWNYGDGKIEDGMESEGHNTYKQGRDFEGCVIAYGDGTIPEESRTWKIIMKKLNEAHGGKPRYYPPL